MELFRDLRFAVRSLSKARLVAVVAVFSLALIVAGNTVIFSIINSLMIRPLPFDPDERIMLVWRSELARPGDQRLMRVLDYQEILERNRVFEHTGATMSGSRSLTGTGEPEQLLTSLVTPSFFDMVEVRAQAGRFFTSEEGRPGAEPVAVLGDSLWRRRFAADPSVLGQTIELDREPHRIVGIMQENFEFLDVGVDVWLPLAVEPGNSDPEPPIGAVVGQLAGGVSPDTARDDLAAIAADLEQRFPETHLGYGAFARTFREIVPGPSDAMLLQLMQAAGVFVLLIACANLANLMLARGESRRRELALRAALGAGRGRIVRQLMTESVLLAVIGGGIGVVLGLLGVDLVAKALAGDVPQGYLPVVDMRVLLFSLLLSIFAGVAFGLLPALRSTRGGLATRLREGGGRGSSTGQGWLRRGLVVAQVALAVVLLCGTGLILKSFLEIQYADPGFDQEGLLSFQLTLPEDRYATEESRLTFFEQIREELVALPDAAGATYASAIPRARDNQAAEVEIVGAPLEEGTPKPFVSWLAVPPGYLDTLSVSILRGRDFAVTDRAETARVAIVDRRFAQRFWPDEEAVGQRLRLRDEEWEVIGVAAPILQRRLGELEGDLNALVYLPWSQSGQQTAKFLLRSRTQDPTALAEPARAAVGRHDPDLPVALMRTYDQVLAATYVGMNVLGKVLGGLATVALALAGLGVYGVLAYSVSQRTQEIGVRTALGAGRRTILGMVLGGALRMAAVGIAVGLPLAFGVTRLLESAIPGMAAGWATFVPIVVAGLLTVIVASSLGPASRATRLDPVKALRAE